MKLKSYELLINTQVGKNAFIFGAGTSINDVISHEIFRVVQNHVVVSVNSSIILFNWDKDNPFAQKNLHWISNDSACRTWEYFQQVKESKCNKIIRDSWSKYYNEIPDFYVFSARHNDLINDENKLVGCSSVPTAIDLAIQMSCKNIFLLGVDHYAVNGKTHFWDFWQKEKQPKVKGFRATLPMQEKIFDLNIKTYKALEKFSKEKNTKIYNCNLASTVNAFEKITLDEIERLL